MATATKKSRTARQHPRTAGIAQGSRPMQFLVFEDNGGGYIWTIVAEDGKRLAQSGSFASHDDAVTAARVVRDGAGSAGLDGFDEDRPVDLAARRQSASARDGLDPERWLDEGGKPNSRAAAALPARP